MFYCSFVCLVFGLDFCFPQVVGLFCGRLEWQFHFATGPRRFVSSDGYAMLVGRDDDENDELTIRMARGNDVFLHASGYAGSHVIIRRSDEREIPTRTLVEAAQLAAHYSKAKTLGRVEVSWTPRKFVSKPRGAKPGLVMLSRHKTIVVRPDAALVRDLKEKTERAPSDENGD